MLVPPNMRKSKWNTRKMFMHPENRLYVKTQVRYALKMYGMDIKISRLHFLDEFMLAKIIHKAPDTFPENVNYLHEINLELILETANQIKDEPNILDENYDKNFGYTERPQYGYSEYSFRGDTWHPEDLFTESKANRNISYLNNMCVTMNPLERGPWNKNFKCYNFDPANIYPRYYDQAESNCEDRRTQINRVLPW